MGFEFRPQNSDDEPAKGSIPDAVLEVEAAADNGRLTLRVVNTTDGLEERDLPRLFERFWRKDAARTGDEHTGLGLSLARVFAGAIGCELSATLMGKGRLVMVLNQRELTSSGG